MKKVSTSWEMDLAQQQGVISALMDVRAYPHAVQKVRLIETHISWVILAGQYAYKIKKAVNYGFLDFSTLCRRQHFCDEEIRLNGRLAPQVYLDVVPVGGTPEAPVLGVEPAIEYAVRMRRFSIANEMDRMIVRGQGFTCAHRPSRHVAGALSSRAICRKASIALRFDNNGL